MRFRYYMVVQDLVGNVVDGGIYGISKKNFTK